MSDPDTVPEDGWNRFFVKSSGLLQRDLSVYGDESLENLIFSVAGDKHGAEIKDAAGSVVMTAVVSKALLSKVEYTNADGTLVGALKTNSVFSKKRLELKLAGGAEWIVVKAAGLKQVYSVLENDVPVAKMDMNSLALKRKYPVDIVDGVDLPLAVGLVWVVNFVHLQRVGAGAAGAAAT